VKRNQSWISLIGSCLMMAVAAALALAVIVAGGSVALAGHQSSAEAQNAVPSTPSPWITGTFSGVVTDSHCGARHLRTSHLSPAECARECVRKGASYVLVDGDRRYALSGSDEVIRKLAGTRVNVTGSREGGTILVSSAAPAF
jgi:hypothetical protein